MREKFGDAKGGFNKHMPMIVIRRFVMGNMDREFCGKIYLREPREDDLGLDSKFLGDYYECFMGKLKMHTKTVEECHFNELESKNRLLKKFFKGEFWPNWLHFFNHIYFELLEIKRLSKMCVKQGQRFEFNFKKIWDKLNEYRLDGAGVDEGFKAVVEALRGKMKNLEHIFIREIFMRQDICELSDFVYEEAKMDSIKVTKYLPMQIKVDRRVNTDPVAQEKLGIDEMIMEEDPPEVIEIDDIRVKTEEIDKKSTGFFATFMEFLTPNFNQEKPKDPPIDQMPKTSIENLAIPHERRNSRAQPQKLKAKGGISIAPKLSLRKSNTITQSKVSEYMEEIIEEVPVFEKDHLDDPDNNQAIRHYILRYEGLKNMELYERLLSVKVKTQLGEITALIEAELKKVNV